MTKKIKSIQCPQCGSSRQTEVRKDYYRCASCGAEYFLDNDDINVNIKHETVKPTTTAKPKNIAAILVMLGIVILALIISTLLGNSEHKKGFVVKERIVEDIFGAAVPYRSTKSVTLYQTDRRYERNNENKDDLRNGMYLIFYDLENKISLKEYKLDNINFGEQKELYKQYMKSSYFEAGDKNYIIVNESNIFEVDYENLSFKDVTSELLSKFDEFDSGIAQISFYHNKNEEAFSIVTNLGKRYTYYPFINYLYNEDNRQNEKKIDKSNLVQKTFFTFTKESSYFPKIPIQLLAITYKQNSGGPSTKPTSIEWRRNYESREKDAKFLFSYYTSYRISFEDITPDRYYFEPKVLHQTEKTLLIKYKATVATNAPTLFQLLNLETKEAVWTKELPASVDLRFMSATSLSDKYYILSNSGYEFHLIPLKEGEIESYRIPSKKDI